MVLFTALTTRYLTSNNLCTPRFPRAIAFHVFLLSLCFAFSLFWSGISNGPPVSPHAAHSPALRRVAMSFVLCARRESTVILSTIGLSHAFTTRCFNRHSLWTRG